MRALVAQQLFTAEILSPVHIGCQMRLGTHDIGVLDGQLVRFDVERMFERLAADPRAMSLYVSEGAAAAARLWPPNVRRAYVRYAVPWAGPPPREVMAHVADPFGRAYLPGSSLKGAIRAGLLWWFLAEGNRQSEYAQFAGMDRRKEWAGQPLTRAVLGQDPNHDLLRALRVFDCTPAPHAALTVVEARAAVMEPDGSLQWIRRAGEHVGDPRRAFAVWAEGIAESASGGMRLAVERDEFLLSESRSSLSGEAPVALLLRWTECCNAFARRIAEGELEFGRRCGLDGYAAFHEARLRDLDRSTGHVYLILGWGTGWRSKTVTEALGSQAIRVVRRIGRLGRGDPFPKTRKILFENGRPTRPPGWVRLAPVVRDDEGPTARR